MVSIIHFSVHAEVVIGERGLDPRWVDRVVLSPDWIEADPADPTVERRFGVIPEFGDRILRVACREDEAGVFVLSCFFDRRARRPA